MNRRLVWLFAVPLLTYFHFAERSSQKPTPSFRGGRLLFSIAPLDDVAGNLWLRGCLNPKENSCHLLLIPTDVNNLLVRHA